MKKLRLSILSFVILILFSCSTYANTYEFDEAYMSADIDTDYYDIVIARNEPVSDDNLYLLRLTQKEVDMIFETQDIYLSGIKFDPYYLEVNIVIKEDDFSKDCFNLTEIDFDNDDIQQAFDEIGSSLSTMGFKFDEAYTKTFNNIRYIVIEGTNEQSNTVEKSYYTVYNGKSISFNFHSFERETLSAASENINATLNSVSFSKTLTNLSFFRNMFTNAASGLFTGAVSAVIIVALVFILKGKRNSGSSKKVKNIDYLKLRIRNIVELLEGEIHDNYPKCDSVLVKEIYEQIDRLKNNAEDWGKNFDYNFLAYKLIYNSAFNLLSSGKFHLYHGVLNPMNESTHLYKICISCLNWYVETGRCTEEQKAEQLEILNENITSVG